MKACVKSIAQDVGGSLKIVALKFEAACGRAEGRADTFDMVEDRDEAILTAV